MVGVNNEEGAYQAIRYLISLGHRRIAYLMGIETVSTQIDRLNGWKRALHEADLPVDDELIVRADPRFYGTLPVGSGFMVRPAPHHQTLPSAYEVLQDLLKLPQHPSAIFVATNQLTLGTLYAFRECGLRCPEDISLISFDDHDWAPLFSPPLTVVRQPTYRLGQTAARLLMQMINGEQVEAPPPLSVELVVRASCGAPPVGVSWLSDGRTPTSENPSQEHTDTRRWSSTDLTKQDSTFFVPTHSHTITLEERNTMSFKRIILLSLVVLLIAACGGTQRPLLPPLRRPPPVRLHRTRRGRDHCWLDHQDRDQPVLRQDEGRRQGPVRRTWASS